MSKISVIVPVYRVEAWLDSCLESLVGQTFRDLEIILVDDGSPDRCGEMCDEWARRDSRIRVIHQENAGASAARRTGILAAEGELISLIDSDDWMEPRMLETLHEALQKNEADIAVCGWINEYENEALPSDRVVPEACTMTRLEALKKLTEPKTVSFILFWNRLAKKEVYDGLVFPQVRRYEDELTAHEILGKARKVAAVDQALYHYRHREGSIMTTGDSEEDHVCNAEFMAIRYEWFGTHDAEELLAPCFETFLSAYTMAVRDLPKDEPELKARVLELSSKGQEMSRTCGLPLSAKDKLILRSPFLWKTLYDVKGKLAGR